FAVNRAPKNTTSILEKAYKHASKGKDSYLKISIGYSLATLLTNKGNYQGAQIVLADCETIVPFVKNKPIGRLYAVKSHIANRASNYTESLRLALLSLSSYTGSSDTTNIEEIYFLVGRAYRVLSRPEQALPYLFKAMATYQEQGNTAQIGYTAELISGCYQYQGKYQLAIDNLQYYTDRYPHQSLAPKFRNIRMFLFLYTKMNNFEKASYYHKKLTDSIFKPYEQDAVIALNSFYFKFKEYDKARIYLERVTIKENTAQANHRLYVIDTTQGKYKSALLHYKRYKLAEDSLQATERQTLIKKLSYDFDVKEKNYALELKDAELKLGKQNLDAMAQHNMLLSQQAKLKDNQFQTAKIKAEKHATELQLKDQNIVFLNKQAATQQKTLSLQLMFRNIVIIVVLLCFLVIYLLIKQYKVKQSAERLLASQNTELGKLVKEKNWLLKEMHHRVKNNLQIVISLIDAQSSNLDSEIAMAAIQESQHRMHSISLIHQKLYQSENLAYIDMKDYINELVNYLSESFDVARRITFSQHIHSIGLDVAQAVPMGLILNEAITNAIKYAFDAQADAQISISLEEIDQHTLSLLIADNGKGMPKNFTLKTSNSLGMTLIKGLGKQLGGDIKLTNANGLTIHMLVKRIEVKIGKQNLTQQTA
ncbi:MAG: sensor histidine kinase, partial [Chitinophagaceae bacterium]